MPNRPPTPEPTPRPTRRAVGPVTRSVLLGLLAAAVFVGGLLVLAGGVVWQDVVVAALFGALFAVVDHARRRRSSRG